MPLKYIITIDYELFGSGKGEITKHVIAPTYKILNILNRNNIKAVFFIEQLEFDAIMALGFKHPKGSRENKDSALVKRQILDIAIQGHDIQLHLHPQWHNANYKKGEWQLNFQWWRFSSLAYSDTNSTQPSKLELLKKGKASLEKLIREVNPNYTCNAFRAGGYNIGTDKDTINALLKNGFKLDSSVCPGYLSAHGLSQYDFTKAPLNKTFWRSDESLILPSNRNTVAERTILELPLLTIRSNMFSKISLARVLNTLINYPYKSVNYQESNKLKSASRAITNSNFDVCLSSVFERLKFKNKIAALDANEQQIITLIGHPKDFNVFSPLLRIVKNIPTQDFITTKELIEEGADV